MPEPAAGSAAPVGRARTLAEVYRRFGEVDAAGTSPLYERVAVALSESDAALRAIEAVPARKRHPTVILAAGAPPVVTTGVADRVLARPSEPPPAASQGEAEEPGAADVDERQDDEPGAADHD